MMRAPVIQGLIRRRLLINFRVDPQVMQRHLPEPFRPKIHEGSAIAGICLIRLETIRPRFLPVPLGISSENAAHRVAVRWSDSSGAGMEGVYIPRRDSDSLFNRLAGGRLFPGEHHTARFQVRDAGENIDLAMQSTDGSSTVEVRARRAPALPASSRFASLAEASDFFEGGSLGYSATSSGKRLDGLALHIRSWQIEPLEVESLFSSYFADRRAFPPGSVEFDCALMMRNVAHEWRPAPDLSLG
jgi:Uncharacterized conserved protein (COG2071)